MISVLKQLLFWAAVFVNMAWISVYMIPAMFKEIFHMVFPRRPKDMNGKVALVSTTLILPISKKEQTKSCCPWWPQ
jgi:hypothetical protein